MIGFNALGQLGRLGNQMFQYAYGLYLARKHDTELFLDTTSYASRPQHGFLLDRFCIQAPKMPLNIGGTLINNKAIILTAISSLPGLVITAGSACINTIRIPYSQEFFGKKYPRAMHAIQVSG